MQLIRTFGLIPYLFHFLHTGSIVSFIVFNNGILFHALLPNNSIMKWFDILCNSILVLYVNIRVMNIFVFTWTIVACLCFLGTLEMSHMNRLKPFYMSREFNGLHLTH